ncbi:MAG TPA: hypothetical protein DCO79_03750 [Spirochaeta sp.]|nr:hypothetical protein [Spirochaeta sp.]
MKKDLESNLTIEKAAATAEILLKYINTSKEPVIDLSVVEKIDLSGIQLLLSAQKTGDKQSKEVYFTGMIKKNVYDRIFSSGFNTVHSESSDGLFKIRRNSSEL